ncbi:MAG: anthranilate synthase component I [candidate division KSB1 bacterium]|nr:anthranilate synthase component I [candidate division KSB1 bacterium]MDZ7366361.1 anthranilate synthase component I [candidate division KSB1 bacterium]MDZ7404016.1 anthranilate synthase component I [candidate division KSB1 bacterium]
MRLWPSFEEFSRLARQGNLVPLSLSLPADTFTPVSIFLRLAEAQRHGFLLESVEGGEKIARYSFLGFAPRLFARYFRSCASPASRLPIERLQPQLPFDDHEPAPADIFAYLQAARKKFQPVRPAGLPRFTGGFVGYFGYDTVRDLENLPAPPPALRPESDQTTTKFPDAEFGLYDTVIVFDHVQQQILLITNVLLDDGELNVRRRYEEAGERLEKIRAQICAPLQPPESRSSSPAHLPEPHANFPRQEFLAAVGRAKEHIAAGDIFQAVLSQRFSCALSVSPFQIYRALRRINPSPYMYFLQHDENCLIGSSPEALLRVENRVAEVRPIAGTRRRGTDAAEDHRLEAELRADAKERAEHLMLVDLGRNDLGRVCEFGSVEANELMAVERYSHVMHLVSNVRGKLRPEFDAIDALRACFPAGTVSGAPKIRAMEIIDKLEPERRGPYAGAVGYLDFSGNLDTCITIRTIWTQGQQAFFQAGAGIVADSDPVREYQETIEKSRAVWNAIDLAERGLES